MQGKNTFLPRYSIFLITHHPLNLQIIVLAEFVFYKCVNLHILLKGGTISLFHISEIVSNKEGSKNRGDFTISADQSQAR